MTLREIAHVHIPTLRPGSTVRDAVDKMDVYQFPALVITNDDMEVLAVITEGDVCRAAQKHGSITKLTGSSAIDFATPHPTTAAADAEISDVLHQMLSSGLTIMPIIDAGRLYGIALRTDLMQAMLLDAASA